MITSQFHLQRLRVLRGGRAAYDQKFHLGVNIIRGENGSGKSTIADFIFYILGGEFENWKTAASKCEEVQAELVTAKGVLTIKREVSKAQTPMHVSARSTKPKNEESMDGKHFQFVVANPVKARHRFSSERQASPKLKVRVHRI